MPTFDEERLKQAVNNLVWTQLPDKTTLKGAEQIAIQVFKTIKSEWDKYCL